MTDLLFSVWVIVLGGTIIAVINSFSIIGAPCPLVMGASRRTSVREAEGREEAPRGRTPALAWTAWQREASPRTWLPLLPCFSPCRASLPAWFGRADGRASGSGVSLAGRQGAGALHVSRGHGL
eukprot:7389073-Prymnesium_polylepis.3